MDLDKEEIQERLTGKIESLKTREGLKESWPLFAVPAVFLLALYFRYLPEQGMQFLQALDPYWIFRQSQHLALEGNIPAVDFMRYFPYNAPFYNFNVGDIIIPAFLYRGIGFLFFSSYLEWAQFYPALMGASGVAAFYFLGKELFDRLTGISVAFFLATIPGVLHRTSAGFFEKEPTGTFFMIVSLYFFTRAWKRKEHWAGLVSGLALGMFTISWGGSKMMWLLYPLVTGLMMWVNEDIENLVIAYTPTILIGGGVASALNPSRFWLTGRLFLANMGLLLFLWSRYLVEEFDLMEEQHLGYYVPSVSFLGGIALILSPLYSNFIAKRFIGVINLVIGGAAGGGVIGKTVAENQPASLGQLAGQLGALSASNIGAYLQVPGASAIGGIFSMLGNITGAWPLAFIGVVLLGTKISAMVLKKAGIFEETVHEQDYYKLLLIVTLLWTSIFSALFQSSIVFAVAPSIVAIIGGIGILYGLEEFKKVEIEFEWYKMLPLLWVVTNVLASISMSRLIFLAAFPVAFAAGYTFSKVIKRIRDLKDDSVVYLGISGSVLLLDLALVFLLAPVTGLPVAVAIMAAVNAGGYLYYPEEWDLSEINISPGQLRSGIITLAVVLTILVNISAVLVSANGLGGSPNQLWMENLEYMEQETPEGSVILSWWDYGYWFESIGRRAAIADGGNNGYYSSGDKINLPLADFLTSSEPENYTDFLRKHSVDYIVLDNTMIGKYSAVSQISREDNQDFNSMLQLNTDRDIRNSLIQNNSILTASRGRSMKVFAPLDQQNSTVDLSTNPDRKPSLELRSRGGASRNDISCVITEDGITRFENVSNPARLRGFGELCLAENPYRSIERSMAFSQNPRIRSRGAQLVLVPEKIADSTLVRLYLMDGHGIDFVEKVEGGSNRFVKMWKVKDLER